MASGMQYDRNALTCAHKTLPFGTMLLVTNQSNGQQVVVEVADRGPYAAGRVVDLSYRAAQELGMLRAGIVRVKVEVLPPGYRVPYRTDEDNPLELPEGMELGLAGTCYEFIPEWEKPKEPELKTVPRKVQTHHAKAKDKEEPATATTKVVPKSQPAKAPHAAASKTAQQAKKQVKKGQESSSWTSFFRDMFD